MSKNKSLATTIVLVIALALMIGGLFQVLRDLSALEETHAQVVAEQEKLLIENDTLKADLDEIAARNQTLAEENDALMAENAGLVESNVALQEAAALTMNTDLSVDMDALLEDLLANP